MINISINSVYQQPMKNIFAHISFRIVLVIIGLHAFVPHPHSDELTEQEHKKLHQNSQSILGFIKYLFHENNDENLDDILFASYGKITKQTIKIQYPRASTFDKKIDDTSIFVFSNIYKTYTSHFHNGISVNQNGLRAPPYYFIVVI